MHEFSFHIMTRNFAVCVCVSSTQSPPGTKVLLLQKVEAQKGFLLLGKNSLEVLGGRVEHLVQKWSLTKVSHLVAVRY